MKINKSYKYRIYPDKEQVVGFSKEFGSSRFIYNYFLNFKKEEYLKSGKNLSCFTMIKELPRLKEEFPWLKECNSQSLQASVENLDVAYTKFFKKLTKFPNFKSKKDNSKTCKVKQGIKILDNSIQIPKWGKVKTKFDRKFEGKILSGTISKNPSNQYFISLCVEEEVKTSDVVEVTKAVGIDVGVKTLAVTSDGKFYPNHKYHRKFERVLKLKQRKLAKKKLGSNRREKARIKVAKIHLKIANKRKDYLQKITTKITNENQVIVLEDLSVKNMMKNHKLAREIAGCSWREFMRMLEYKAKWKNHLMLKVDRWFPSSKTCSNCGFIHRKLSLKDRMFVCPNCNYKADRDLQASQNILKQGINDFNLTTVGTMGCDARGGSKTSYSINGVNYLFNEELSLMKREAIA